MTQASPQAVPHDTAVERFGERVLFASRWLLAPMYFGLALSMVVLLVKFAQRAIVLFTDILVTDTNTTIVEVLALVDLSLMANLVIMVMFAGYENFISKMELEGNHDKPDWMGHVGFGDLKLKLLASIVAIAAIHVLESFMKVANYTDRELAWDVGILLVFVVSGLLLAIMDRIAGDRHA